jgi:hypothetical protein
MRAFTISTPPHIITVVSSGRVRWVGHVSCIGEMRNMHTVLIRKPEGKRQICKYLGTYRRVILKWSLKK